MRSQIVITHGGVTKASTGKVPPDGTGSAAAFTTRPQSRIQDDSRDAGSTP